MIIDVAALDVIDSFACHTLRALAQSHAYAAPTPSSSESNPTSPSR